MCDQQLQGIAWIKDRESKNSLQVVRMEIEKDTVDIMEKTTENKTRCSSKTWASRSMRCLCPR